MTAVLLWLAAGVILALGYVVGAAIAGTRFERRCALCRMLRRRIEQFSGRQAGRGGGSDE